MTRPLSRREWQVAELIRQGKRNQEIADSLGISLATVREYVRRIMHVLHQRNRTAIAIWAVEHQAHTT